MFFVFTLCAGLFLGFFDTPIQHRKVTDPAGDFERKTGIKWPAEAKLIAAHDSHSDRKSGPALGFGLNLDGKLHIKFETDSATLEKWLSEPAPWGNKYKERQGGIWLDGPVPKEIAMMTGLQNDFNSQEIKFVARERGGPRKGDLAYWDGELLVLDVKSGRVWLWSWNY